MKYLFTVLFVLWCVTSLAAGQIHIVTPRDFVMSPATAREWLEATAPPLIVQYGNDPSELPAVRSRLEFFIHLRQTDRLKYSGMPFYSPQSRNILAHVDYDLKENKPFLMVFVPAFMAYQKRVEPEVFRNQVVIAYVHEMIHIEQVQNGEFHWLINQPHTREGDRQEAAAFGKTILQVVRPWLARGRHVDQTWVVRSKLLARCGDDYADPRWIDSFRRYMR
jgi:hypothetical protein